MRSSGCEWGRQTLLVAFSLVSRHGYRRLYHIILETLKFTAEYDYDMLGCQESQVL